MANNCDRVTQHCAVNVTVELVSTGPTRALDFGFHVSYILHIHT